MNIVPTTPSAPTSTAVKPDGSTTGHIVPDAEDGTDVPSSGGETTSTKGFGSMLARHLDDARGEDTKGATVVRGRVGVDPKAQADTSFDEAIGDDNDTATTHADAPAVDARSGAGAVVPQGLFPTLATSTTTTTSTSALQSGRDITSRKGRLDDDDNHDGDAGSDLAAQLALASQWTVAKPVDTAAPATGAAVGAAGADTAQGGFDVKALLGKDRALSGKDDTARVQGIAASAAGAATSASGDAAGADARQRDERGAAADASLVAAKDDTKARNDLALAALDAASVAATTTPTDTIANSDAFALRLATHMAGAAAPVGTTVATAASTTAATTTAATTTSAFIQEPVGTNAWSHEVGQATLRMAANDLQSASIRLNPEHLGPLDVQVRVDNGVAHLAFDATHVDTRQALEASRGTLDQLFANQGLKMGDVSVGSGSSNGSNDASASRNDQAADASRRDGGRWSGSDAGDDGDASTTNVTTRITRALGLVDTFA